MAKIKECEKCGEVKRIFAKSLCTKCYYSKRWLTIGKAKRKEFLNSNPEELEKLREYAKRKWIEKDYQMNYEEYLKITKRCVICGFDKIVEVHHRDCNHKNNSKDNLIGLCPNHHKMAHNNKYKEDIKKLLTKVN